MNPTVSFWLKVIATAFLIMVINVAISFFEVYIFTLFVPGKPRAFYDAHALVSAPWVAGIAGGILMYIFTRNYMKAHLGRRLPYAIGLPTAYAVIDLGILLAMRTEIADSYIILILAGLAKICRRSLSTFC